MAGGVTRTLRRGMKGEDVSILQQTLTAAGFSTKGVDGDFGGNTDSAVRAFQKSRGLAVTGVVESKTLAALGLGAAPVSVAPAAPVIVQKMTSSVAQAVKSQAPEQAKAAAQATVTAAAQVSPALAQQAVEAKAKVDAATTPAEVRAALDKVEEVAQRIVVIQKEGDGLMAFLQRKYGGVPVWGFGAALSTLALGFVGWKLYSKSKKRGS